MSILDKIRKLRALATSDNLNEAAAAAAAAERLIQEHAISEAEICTSEDQPIGVDGTPIAVWKGQIPTWESRLGVALARAYSCDVLAAYGPTGNRVLVAAGRASDIETLRYQFAFFVAEITRLTSKEGRGRGRTWANSFRLGAVDAIAAALKAAQRATHTSASSNALAVIDARAAAAEAAMTKAYPGRTSRAGARTRFNPSGYAAGQRAGANINQRSQIGNGGVRLLT